MKIILSFIALLLSLLYSTDVVAGRCTGSSYCSACSDCSACKHCNGGGGTCGVCGGGEKQHIEESYEYRNGVTRSADPGTHAWLWIVIILIVLYLIGKGKKNFS